MHDCSSARTLMQAVSSQHRQGTLAVLLSHRKPELRSSLLARPGQCTKFGTSLQLRSCPAWRTSCTTCLEAALMCNWLLQLPWPNTTLPALQSEVKRCLTCSQAASLCQLPPAQCCRAAHWTPQSSLLQPAVHLPGASTGPALSPLAQPQGAALRQTSQQRAGLGGLRGLQSR